MIILLAYWQSLITGGLPTFVDNFINYSFLEFIVEYKIEK